MDNLTIESAIDYLIDRCNEQGHTIDHVQSVLKKKGFFELFVSNSQKDKPFPAIDEIKAAEITCYDNLREFDGKRPTFKRGKGQNNKGVSVHQHKLQVKLWTELDRHNNVNFRKPDLSGEVELYDAADFINAFDGTTKKKGIKSFYTIKEQETILEMVEWGMSKGITGFGLVRMGFYRKVLAMTTGDLATPDRIIIAKTQSEAMLFTEFETGTRTPDSSNSAKCKIEPFKNCNITQQSRFHQSASWWRTQNQL